MGAAPPKKPLPPLPELGDGLWLVESKRVADWTTHVVRRGEKVGPLSNATHHRAEELDCPICVRELAPKTE